ncbi:hypothetical protein [Winogradskyella alexanderae]|uniref:Uncharacterized protein n=1 Tax=Winogradskyella alexanderae TaxID=2877123 RepID=A0ABS7XRF4_9FLAO|nr:hypothetical protein [Winogradskyella alexanderae]MCA0132602.1 hypothetical protein [Winogradskyella alexanderae]
MSRNPLLLIHDTVRHKQNKSWKTTKNIKLIEYEKIIACISFLCGALFGGYRHLLDKGDLETYLENNS